MLLRFASSQTGYKHRPLDLRYHGYYKDLLIQGSLPSDQASRPCTPQTGINPLAYTSYVWMASHPALKVIAQPLTGRLWYCSGLVNRVFVLRVLPKHDLQYPVNGVLFARCLLPTSPELLCVCRNFFITRCASFTCMTWYSGVLFD